MSEATRLKTLINRLKINASQFAERAGIKQPVISAVTGGKKRITIDMVHSIRENFPFVNLDWLLNGRGEIFISVDTNGEDVVNEPIGEYLTIKSPNSIHADNIPDEETMKAMLSENLRKVAKRWGITQPEMLELLGGGVGRQGASLYFKGSTLPRLPLLLRLERLTGWPLETLATLALTLDQIPPAPLLGAIQAPPLSRAETAELRDELHRLRLRIGRIIDKIDNH